MAWAGAISVMHHAGEDAYLVGPSQSPKLAPMQHPVGVARLGGLRGVRIDRPPMILVFVRLYMSWIKHSFRDKNLPLMLEVHGRAREIDGTSVAGDES